MKLLNNFIDIKITSNLLVKKCYKRLFSKDIFFTNIGNYILLFIIIIHIIGTIIFYIKEFPSIFFKITNIIKIKKIKKTIKKVKTKI